MSDYLTVTQAADRLGVGHDAILEMLHSRKLPAIDGRIYGIGWLIHAGDLERYGRRHAISG